ncbi:ATP biosynthetic process [Balamuthia mandrillaris]
MLGVYACRNLVEEATANNDSPTPGYLYNEIAKRTFKSLKECEALEDMLLSRLAKSSSPAVKLKALIVIKKVIQMGDVSFRKDLQRRLGPIRTCLDFRGPPDPIHGDVFYTRVREEAEQVMNLLFANLSEDSQREQQQRKDVFGHNSNNEATVSSVPSFPSSKKKMEGFGSDSILPSSSSSLAADLSSDASFSSRPSFYSASTSFSSSSIVGGRKYMPGMGDTDYVPGLRDEKRTKSGKGVLGQVLNFASSLQQQQTSVHVPSTSHSGISIFQTSPGSYEAPSNNTTSSTSSTKKSRGHRRKGMVGGGWQDVTPLSSNNGIAASQHQQQQRPNYDVYDSSSSDEDDDEEYDEETRVEASALFMGLSASDNNATSSNDPPQNNNGEKIATKNTNLLLDLFDDELPKAGSPSHSVISNSTPPLVQNGAVKAAPSSSPSSSLFSGMNVYEEQEQEHEQSSQQASTAGLIFDFINPSPSSPSSSSSSFSSSASSSSSSSSSAKSSSLLEHGIASQLADLNFSSSSSTFISRKTTTSTTPTTTTVKVQPNVIANNPAIALTSYASTVPSGYYVYPTITPLSSYSSHHMVSPPLSSSSSSTSFSPVGARRTSSSPSLLQTANSSIPEDGNADELSSNFSFVIAHTKKNASSSSSSTRVAARGKGERSGASSDAFSFVQDAIKANTGVHNT